MRQKFSLGNFFLLVFGAVLLLALTWLNFRRTNYNSNQTELYAAENEHDGEAKHGEAEEEVVDITSPFYDHTNGENALEEYEHGTTRKATEPDKSPVEAKMAEPAPMDTLKMETPKEAEKEKAGKKETEAAKKKEEEKHK